MWQSFRYLTVMYNKYLPNQRIWIKTLEDWQNLDKLRPGQSCHGI